MVFVVVVKRREEKRKEEKRREKKRREEKRREGKGREGRARAARARNSGNLIQRLHSTQAEGREASKHRRRTGKKQRGQQH